MSNGFNSVDMNTEHNNNSVPEERFGCAEDVNRATEREGTASAVPEEETVAAGCDGNAPEEAGAADAVSFADEDAALAASEAGLDIEETTEEERDAAEADDAAGEINGLDRAGLVDYFGKLLAERPVQQIRREAEAVKVAFYKLHRADYEQQRKAFVEAGGRVEEFVARPDVDEARLKEYFADYRRRRAEYISAQEKNKEENLQKKLRIIEELKELVSGSEMAEGAFATFRELQQRWREIGLVPQANVKELWENYNHHVENFYNYIKINKELRDLDLRRNYEEKLALCEAAEALSLEPSVVAAFRKLQDLHEKWRETGPVAAEYKESLWERFREASTRINKQHQDYFERIKQEQKHNLELKTELCVKVEELAGEILTTRKEWNKASDRLIEIQKVWKTIGFAPQKDNTRIYERFRNACDRFFAQKREFYEQMRTEMDHNYQLKVEICEAAEAMQESEQWKKTTDELIALQKRWKEIGPVPRRHADAVWKRFRAACDKFFERKAAHFSDVDARNEENLKQKEALLAEMEAADIAAGGFEQVKEFQRRWNEIGFVPIRRKDELQKRYRTVVDEMFATLRGGARERSMDRFRSKVSEMKGGGDRRLRIERDRLYNKLKQLEGDVATLENNIGFFSRSKNAEAMIREVEGKIGRARAEMADLIEKIKMIDRQEAQAKEE